VECDRRYATDIKRLMQFAKENKLVSKMWGKHAHVSKIVDKDLTPSEIKCLARITQVHCNYQCSMSLEDVVGVTNLNGKAVLDEAGLSTPLRFTLGKLLLHYIHLRIGC
jgi:hypothetical protein